MSDDIELTPVNSSNLVGVHYNPATQVLTVEFKSGGRYSYGGVVKSHYEALLKAKSPGGYLHKNIRGRYDHSKL
jgi:hypothetical protein